MSTIPENIYIYIHIYIYIKKEVASHDVTMQFQMKHCYVRSVLIRSLFWQYDELASTQYQAVAREIYVWRTASESGGREQRERERKRERERERSTLPSQCYSLPTVFNIFFVKLRIILASNFYRRLLLMQSPGNDDVPDAPLMNFIATFKGSVFMLELTLYNVCFVVSHMIRPIFLLD